MGRAWPAKFHQRNRAAGGLVDMTKPSGFVTHATASNDVLQLPLHKAQNRFESAQAGKNRVRDKPDSKAEIQEVLCFQWIDFLKAYGIMFPPAKSLRPNSRGRPL